jgi:hypothetical protein
MGFREFLIELTGALIKEDCNKNVTTTNISLKYEIWDGYIKVAYFFIYTPYKKRSTNICRRCTRWRRKNCLAAELSYFPESR